MEFKNQGIKCKTFWGAQTVIKKTEAKIKGAKSNKERQYFAQDILLETESLFSCPNYNAGNSDCISCRSISRSYIKEYEYLAKHERRKLLLRNRRFYV